MFPDEVGTIRKMEIRRTDRAGQLSLFRDYIGRNRKTETILLNIRMEKASNVYYAISRGCHKKKKDVTKQTENESVQIAYPLLWLRIAPITTKSEVIGQN